MGTRSCSGVRIDNADKLTYNHFDGYPSGVGQEILTELKVEIAKMGDLENAIGTWKQKARRLELVDEESTPTPQQIEKLKEYAVTHSPAGIQVASGRVDDWYNLMRQTHGSILKRLEAGFAIDNNAFITGSLFCEWAYVLNLDDETLEIYKGFQKGKHDKGRYGGAELDEMGYGGCVLIATIKISDLSAIEELEPYLVSIGAIESDDEDEASAQAAE